MNFYLVLGIPRNATGETIRDAYRALARRYHPDRGPGSSAEKFRQIAEAYEVLSHPVRIPVEPMTTHLKTVHREDPRVFGWRW